MIKIDLDEVKNWVSETVNMHSHDLIAALAHRYQVSRTTASTTIKKLEQAGVVKRSGSKARPVFEPASNVVVMHSYSLPLQDTEQVWRRDIAPFFLQGLTENQRNLLHDGFVAMAGTASDYSQGTTLHIIAEKSFNNIEMTFQDNGVGAFKQIAQSHPNMTTATGLLNAQLKAPSHQSITALANAFDYFQIEANGLHFPEEMAPEANGKDGDDTGDAYRQGTTVIIGLTLNHEVN